MEALIAVYCAGAKGADKRFARPKRMLQKVRYAPMADLDVSLNKRGPRLRMTAEVVK